MRFIPLVIALLLVAGCETCPTQPLIAKPAPVPDPNTGMYGVWTAYVDFQRLHTGYRDSVRIIIAKDNVQAFTGEYGWSSGVRYLYLSDPIILLDTYSSGRLYAVSGARNGDVITCRALSTDGLGWYANFNLVRWRPES